MLLQYFWLKACPQVWSDSTTWLRDFVSSCVWCWFENRSYELVYTARNQPPRSIFWDNQWTYLRQVSGDLHGCLFFTGCVGSIRNQSQSEAAEWAISIFCFFLIVPDWLRYSLSQILFGQAETVLSFHEPNLVKEFHKFALCFLHGDNKDTGRH